MTRRSHGPTLPLALALSAALATACDRGPEPPIVRDPDLAALELAVSWPAPERGSVVTLANIYMATNQDERGREYFQAQSDLEPEDPLLLAFAGLFQVRTAMDVRLLERVEWVEDGIAMLDRAVELDPNLPRFLRALTLARLPPRFERADEAIAELEDLLEDPDSFVFSAGLEASTRQPLVRQGWQAMALAAETQGDQALAERAWANAGNRPQGSFDPILGTNYSVDGERGFRFAAPSIWTPAPGIHVAQGYDFGDIACVETDAGLVLIDAGTHVENAALALAEFREQGATGPVHTVILTHAHWDHIGGIEGVLEPGTQTIAQAAFAEELAIVNEAGLDYQWFFGASTARTEAYGPLYSLNPDLLIDAPTQLSIGGVEFVLHPVSGGETEDALLIELPERGVVFVGDAYMPYLGAPFVGEGSADGLLATTEYLASLEPSLLIHGHPPLTEAWTAEVLEPFAAAMAELRTHTLRGIMDGRSVEAIVQSAPLPELLADHPDAVMPVIVTRTQFIQRLHRSRTGYWQPGGEGLTTISEGQWAVALDLLADGKVTRWTDTIEELLASGDLDLAWRLAERAIQIHPDDPKLISLRLRTLAAQRSRYQQYNPFKFIVYSELAGAPNPALGCDTPDC